MIQDRSMMIINIPLVTDTSQDIDSDLTVSLILFGSFANSLLIDVLSILSFVLLYHEPHSLYIIYCLIVITYI